MPARRSTAEHDDGFISRYVQSELLLLSRLTFLVLIARCISTSAPQRSTRGGVVAAVGVGLFGVASYFIGSLYPPSFIALAFAPPAPPPSLANSPEGIAETARVEALLQNLPQVKAFKLQSLSTKGADLSIASTSGKENPTTAITKDSPSPEAKKAQYVLSRPFSKLAQEKAVHSLTSGSLRKPGMLAAPPLVVSKTKHGASELGGHQGDAYAFVHLGRSLCGHDGIVHGGLLATVLDETLARTSFFSLPSNVGVTARLEIDYRKPVKADQVVVIETRLIEAKGRKVTVEGVMRTLEGDLLVESRAIFVEPRILKWLNTSAVREIIDMSDE
jgi:acyl-coenzyme A thioesterase PaaI-like protein